MAFLTLMSTYPVLYVCDLFRIPKDQVQEIEKGDATRTFDTVSPSGEPSGAQQVANTLTHSPAHSRSLFEHLQEPKPDHTLTCPYRI